MNRSIRALLLASILFLLSASCGGDDGNLLVVDVVTDLVAGIEVDRIRTELLLDDASGTVGEAVVVNEVDALGIAGLSTTGGRVAEFGQLAPGDYLVRAQALLGDGVVAERTVTLELRGSSGVSIVISRSCRGITCPGAGDPGRANSCIGGLCAEPSCLTGREDGCTPRECATAADCPTAPDACGTPACTAGLCVVGLDDSACSEGARCHPELGCVDATECLELPELCNALDDDCDGESDEGFDLTNTLEHCGACGNSCISDNAEAACVDGMCEVECDQGFLDCNGNPEDGCEASIASPERCGDCATTCEAPTPLCGIEPDGSYACIDDCAAGTVLCGGSCVDITSDPAHCNGCDNECTTINGTPGCDAGACGVARCDPGFGDCPTETGDGCETQLNTLQHCGGCGVACDLVHAEESCASGTCLITSCEAGWDDCDGDPSNGCESELNTVENCGACGSTCERANGGATCATGSCALTTCNTGFENCDGEESNGCESLLTTTDCGSCGVACSPYRATGTCTTGDCRIGSCNPGWGDCTGGDANGCETSLRDPLNCGGCGVVCTLANARPTCTTGSCTIGRCNAGYQNCDGRESTGCETLVASSRNHCGACNNPCTPGDECYLGRCVPELP